MTDSTPCHSDSQSIIFVFSQNDLLPGYRFAASGVSFCGLRKFKASLGFGQVLFALLFDVSLDYLLINSNGGGEISNTPDSFFVEIHFFDEFKLLPETKTRHNFHLLNTFGYSDIWWNDNLHVDVVFVSGYRKDFNGWIFLFEFFEAGKQDLQHV